MCGESSCSPNPFTSDSQFGEYDHRVWAKYRKTKPYGHYCLACANAYTVAGFDQDYGANLHTFYEKVQKDLGVAVGPALLAAQAAGKVATEAFDAELTRLRALSAHDVD